MKKNKIKIIIIFCFTIAIAASFTFKAINKAYYKQFWGDEVTDLFTTIPSEPSKMVMGKVENQQSGSPLYFILQHFYIKKSLLREKNQGSGLNWNVQFRIVAIVSLVLSMVLAAVLLAKINWLLALLLPMLLSTYDQTLWFAAELRIYGSWLAACLFFYVCSIRFLESDRKVDGLLWLFSVVLVMSIAISTPILIICLICVVVLWRLLNGQKACSGSEFAFCGMALGLVLFLFRIWNVRGSSGTQFAFRNFNEPFSYYWNHFSYYGLDMFGGLKGFLFLVLGSLLLVVLPERRKHQNRADGKTYTSIGLIGCSQILAALGIYVLQIGVGYFFAPRHVIFILAVRALVFGAFGVFIFEILFFDYILAFSRKSKWLEPYAKAVKIGSYLMFVGIASLNWWKWNFAELPVNFRNSLAFVEPYCHGAVLADTWTVGREHLVGDVALLVNVNQLRHQGRCVESREICMKSNCFDYSPQWIYGK